MPKSLVTVNKCNNQYVGLHSGAVEISSAELSHAGRYSCTAKNIAGSTQRHVPLTVHGK